MKATYTILITICIVWLSAVSSYAQCPVIVCMDDITLYADETGCSAELQYTTPQVVDYCHFSTPFYFTGSEEVWVVPDGVTEIWVNAWGASGGYGSGPGFELNTGGKGAYVGGKLAVIPGDTLRIRVGGKGENAKIGETASGGWNGGGEGGMDSQYTGNGAGGGGGATDLRLGGSGLEHRVLVAAGGGGAAKNAPGGGGGAPAGLDGLQVADGYGGLGGTLLAAGGVFTTDRGATPGTSGMGGNGSTGLPSWGGGGGGAGYYGGGGGTATADHNEGFSGGGGGGSSYFGSLTETDAIANQRNGNGVMVIYHDNPIPQTAQLISGPESGEILTIGEYTLTFEAYGVFDTTYCNVQVNVLDTIAPVVLSRNISVILDENDEAHILPEDVDDGTFDNCGLVSLTIDQQLFGLDDEGENTVILTATDESGNTASAPAVVTIVRQPQGLVLTPDIMYNGSTSGNGPGALRMFAKDEDDYAQPKLKLMPNPAAEYVELLYTFSSSAKWAWVLIHNIEGQEVGRIYVADVQGANQLTIPIQDYAPGTYLVQLTTSNQSITKRLVVNR